MSRCWFHKWDKYAILYETSVVIVWQCKKCYLKKYYESVDILWRYD